VGRVLVVEDDHLIGTMVKLNLETAGHEVVWATSGEAGLEAADGARFDAVLLDITLPGMSGVQVARALRDQGVGTPILMLTARDETALKIQALDGGADDYITKPFDMGEMLARVRAQIRRSQGAIEVPVGAVLQVGGVTLHLDRQEIVTADGAATDPGEKELALLAVFAREPGRVFSRADLLEEVWGMDAMPTERTVDNFIVRLRRLVEAEPEEPRHIVTVRGRGYRYDP
jgi:two-component system response regulator RegX3